ncbi:uncharacterized protein [Blastocystis hominis]|uniref:Uncharacterized protein n=1 Tax=Blastocystis hominis TaxID=12968 RepID=D8M4G8_BLAHO|nr:uncharacterized protein [Blastocystis hominis]CBK22957.2 unnamed protein product [Blastocystis hominis]|eukprot:XP_012897005.1 uncharacterized protein [Blastocystis hominis]
MEDILAIDFGTTNSTACAFNNNNRVQLWNNQDSGEFLFPSFVDYTDKGVKVGKLAKLNMGKPGHFVVSCVKRLIGLRYDEYLKLEKKDIFGCDVVRGDDGYPYFVVSEDGSRMVSCIDVACELFKWIKASAEAICERTFAKAYVTRPANFLDHQVKAIRQAAEKAGLKIDKMITEPTAAGLSWCKTTVKELFPTLKKDTNVFVVDFGGGTLDFSVIRYLGNNQFRVEDNAGNPCLGGNDIDNAIMDLVLAKLRNDYGVVIDKSKRGTARKLARLRNICEDVKIEVNMKTTDDDNYEAFLRKNEHLTYEIDVSYLTTEVEVITLPFRKVTEAIMNCMESAPSQMPGLLPHILLVGGSSQLVVFRQLLFKEQFKRKRFEKIDPITCVSQGAYELACIMNDKNAKMSMTEPIAISYGLKSGNDQVAIILSKGTAIPCTSSEKMFCNCDDYPERINISVYQCEDDEGQELVDIEKCTEVESWQFINPEDCRRPRGQQQLTLRLKLEVGGTLQVICKDFAFNRVLLDEKADVLYENDYCVYFSLT